ncbi:mechanosensitive ion channel family protein [Halobaculum sp. MBLA0143]|uniref:mechanosensitive ion channel family protein n=1 Tax=Halobaculum sp. MBLA0143 TaxID=3079933 RepID=UPI0035232FA8
MFATLVDDLQRYLEGFVTTEARLAATAFLLVVAAVGALVAAPRVVRAARRVVVGRLLESPRVPVDAGRFDWRVPTRLLVRLSQSGVVVGAVLSVLVVWGYVDTAETTVGFLAGLVPTVVRAAGTIGVVAGAFVGIDVLETWLESYAAESDTLNEHQQGIVFRVLQLSVLAAGAVGALTVWGVNLDGLFVGAGFLGIVVGTAARTTLGSLIAGFVLMFSRPFELGDWVEVDGDEGIVTDITVVNTRIRNQHGEEVVLPNERVANATITNRTRLGQLRLSVDVGVDYDADVPEAESVVADALDEVPEILSNPTPQVVPKSLGDSAVVLECRFWIDHPSAARRTMAKAAVVRAVKAALDEAGVKIPYPQRELLGREESGGFQVESRAERTTPTTDGGHDGE